MNRHDDLESIKQLKAKYFRTIDQQDWVGYRSVFTDDVVIDTTDDTGEIITGADTYVDGLAPLLSGSITTHHGHTVEISFTGDDTATGIWAMEDHIWFKESIGLEKLWGTGWYEEEYRRVDGTWLIASMRLRRQRVEFGGKQTFPPTSD